MTNETNNTTTNDDATNNATTNDTTKSKSKSRRATSPKKATLGARDIAKKYNLRDKTLRAKIRANDDEWRKYYTRDNTRYVFKNNATTLRAIEKLLGVKK